MREAKVDCVGICEILQANTVECCGGHENVSPPGTQVRLAQQRTLGSVHSCDGYPRCRTRAQNRYISDEKEWEELMGECMDKEWE